MKTIRDYYKVDVSKYVRINFTIFETGVTDIGGVKVDMTEAEAKYMNQIAGEENGRRARRCWMARPRWCMPAYGTWTATGTG